MTRVYLRLSTLLPGVEFAASHGVIGLTVMGLVFLSVTGAEALYADLGHFGRRPISFAWMWLVFPSLALNYLGQGALVLSNPSALENPFFRLYPQWALFPMIVLATLATVIASQAVITGAFSLTRQAVQLDLMPTSRRSSHVRGHGRPNLLASYKLAFARQRALRRYRVPRFEPSRLCLRRIRHRHDGHHLVMAFFIIWKLWGWSIWRAAALILPLVLIELAFFMANILKIVEGGWLPLAIAGCVGLVMATWIRGARLVQKEFRKNEAELDWLIKKLEAKPPLRVSGTAVFLTPDVNSAPTSLMHNLKHNRILHERNIVLSIKTNDVPRVPRRERLEIDRSNETFIKITAHYGFMETPSIPKIFNQCRRKSLNVDLGATSFFVSRRVLRPSSKSEMPRWQEMLFIALTHGAEDATTYFQIPTDRVVEVGTQIAV